MPAQHLRSLTRWHVVWGCHFFPELLTGTWLFFFLIKIDLLRFLFIFFIWEAGRRREISHPQVHSSNAHNSRFWTRPKPGAGNSMSQLLEPKLLPPKEHANPTEARTETQAVGIPSNDLTTAPNTHPQEWLLGKQITLWNSSKVK